MPRRVVQYLTMIDLYSYLICEKENMSRKPISLEAPLRNFYKKPIYGYSTSDPVSSQLSFCLSSRGETLEDCLDKSASYSLGSFYYILVSDPR